MNCTLIMRGDSVAGYDLDDKKGFFSKFTSMAPSKFLTIGDDIKLKHYNNHNKFDTKLVYFDDGNIRIQTAESFEIKDIIEGDPVVLSTNPEKIEYAIAGDISAIDLYPPFKVDVKVNKIESMKELRKHKRFFTSEIGKIKMLGDSEYRKVIIKNVSFGGIKINAKDDIDMKEELEVRIEPGQDLKIIFTGKVVRKIRLSGGYEYGLEISRIVESNLLQLHRFINSFEFN